MASKIDNITSLPDIRATKFRTEAEVNRAIDEYIRKVKESGQPTQMGGELLYFFELVQNAVNSRQTTENIPEDKRLLLTAEEPPREMEPDTEAITFALDLREAGQIAGGPVGAGGTKEVVPHQRSVQDHPEHLGEKLITMGRFFDNLVNFYIYAATDKQGLSRLLWFENVMDSFRWYFRIYRLLSLEQRAERIGRVDIGGLSLVKYKLSYYVRTEDTYQFGSQELRRLKLNMYMANS